MQLKRDYSNRRIFNWFSNAGLDAFQKAAKPAVYNDILDAIRNLVSKAPKDGVQKASPELQQSMTTELLSGGKTALGELTEQTKNILGDSFANKKLTAKDLLNAASQKQWNPLINKLELAKYIPKAKPVIPNWLPNAGKAALQAATKPISASQAFYNVLKLRNTAKDIPEAFVYGSESNPLKLGGARKDILSKYENLQGNSAVGNSMRIPEPGDTDFIGPLPELEHHFIMGNGIGPKQRGVLGAHNAKFFNSTLESTGFPLEQLKIGDPIPHPTIDGIYAQRYTVPAYDGRGNFIGFKNIRDPKTVFDPNKILGSQMLKWGKESMASGTTNGRIVEGIAPNGLQYRGYIENGKITGFFPKLPD